MGLFLNQNIDADKSKEGIQKAMCDYVYKFWHLLDETLNAILFILIGLEIIIIFESFQIPFLFISLLVILLVILSRWIGVTIPIFILSFFKNLKKENCINYNLGWIERRTKCSPCFKFTR